VIDRHAWNVILMRELMRCLWCE